MGQVQIGQHFFTLDQLQTAIAATQTLSKDKKGALIGGVDASGAHAAFVVRISDHVEFDTAVAWNPTTGVNFGGQVIASWQ